MRIQNGGIFREIDSKDFGKYQQKGWTKVTDEPVQKEEKKEEIKQEEIIVPIKHKDIIDDTMDEVLGEFNIGIEETPAKPKPKAKPRKK